MEKKDKNFYNKIQTKVFEEKQVWWFSCRLGYNDEATFLIKDYSFEDAIIQLTNATEELGYDDYNIFEWDINVDKKVDYDYSNKDFLELYRQYNKIRR